MIIEATKTSADRHLDCTKIQPLWRLCEVAICREHYWSIFKTVAALRSRWNTLPVNQTCATTDPSSHPTQRSTQHLEHKKTCSFPLQTSSTRRIACLVVFDPANRSEHQIPKSIPAMVHQSCQKIGPAQDVSLSDPSDATTYTVAAET